MNSERRRGALYGGGAYLLWGVFPLYFRLLERSGAVEVVLHRVLWSLLVCLLVVAATRGGADLRLALRSPRRVALLGTAAALLAVNWGVYIYAVNSGHVVEASLGYFVNPLVTVLLGVLVLRERLRPLQWAAVGVGALAVTVLTVDYGRPPWVALLLALTFGLYGLIKNRVGAAVGALASLTSETLVLAPLAAALLLWVELTGRGHFADHPPWQGLLLASAGVATVVPLLFFAAAARRVPLSTMGLLQYITPTLQLLCGVLLLGERMAASRWAGFALVWVALVVLTADSLAAARRRDGTGWPGGPARDAAVEADARQGAARGP
jgi:chloramphenicol-sensitive protein RarD